MSDAATYASDAFDLDRLRAHVGHRAEATDRIDTSTVLLLDDVTGAGSPGEPRDGDVAPLGIHWCIALPGVPLSGLQDDGHPSADHTILPRIPGARRMWAAGTLSWKTPLHVGDVVTRRSVVTDIAVKSGRSGPLCFVTVAHSYEVGDHVAVEERQDIVFRTTTAATPPTLAPSAPGQPGTFVFTIVADPVRLFRYSALTGNAHRIHYDHPYATGAEGYPGLVVHGPFQATMLMQAAARRGRVGRFAYRAVAPLFSGERITVMEEADGAAFWTTGADGRPGMRADVEWAGS
ncbi:MaoC family dehydratase N-terminal domain-containing protein [uncultured Sphingomonas sp.]|uniref:FAS1-like dehydratase domain-containing protein n=1 Tax=uncultured Sphingomonas sp. TaxID=158754 RepID=UPI0035C98082